MALAAAVLLSPGVAHAHGGEASPGFLEFIISFIEGLGPWGPAAFVATVALAECIPLFPTQASRLREGRGGDRCVALQLWRGTKLGWRGGQATRAPGVWHTCIAGVMVYLGV